MHLRRKSGKRKTGFKLLLIVVLVMCGVLTYSTGKAKAEEREIEITDESGNAWHLCTWCEDLFPEGELREEVDLGHLCDRCIAAIHSRGESLTLKY